jgi:murein DD-endopeptidase MepM/ murein hydrolase activator NlpD
MRVRLVVVVVLALVAASSAHAYGWPVKPFDKPHPIRSAFGDPRFHVSGEGEVSAFHFGVDIVASDGTAVYSVEPGVVERRHATSVTIGRDSGRRYGYWHIRPVVRSGTYVRRHQLIGYILKGWGHVHFAESLDGYYRNPLRWGALTPFVDHTKPTVASIEILDSQGNDPPADVSGSVAVVAEAYDTPPILPPAPWDVARLAPESISWKLRDVSGAVLATGVSVTFANGIPSSDLYGFVYAPGTYQNKPHRPGRYLYRVIHDFDTTAYPNGSYQLEVDASDSRRNVDSNTINFTIANG